MTIASRRGRPSSHHVPPLLRTVTEEEASSPSPPRDLPDWKRRRTVVLGSMDYDSLAENNANHKNNSFVTVGLESTLSMTERVVGSPPSLLLQNHGSNLFLPVDNDDNNDKDMDSSVDSTDGQAARAATAFLGLDDSDSD
jgi:hypothetical protein